MDKLNLQKQKRETGANMVEYVLLMMLITVFALAATKFLGRSVSSKFSEVGSTFHSM